MNFLEEVFKLLIENKTMPYYQAERRVDIFINLFLAEILNYKLNKTNIEFVLPELALKKEKNNLSTKVDYLCFDRVEKVVYFVEFKTDFKSFNKEQFTIYQTYKNWGKCLTDIESIAKKTKEKQKFNVLKSKLNECNLLGELAESYPIKIIYLAPESTVTREKITKLNKSHFTELIDYTEYIGFSSLKEFKSSKFPAEWDFLYWNCIDEMQKHAFE